LASLHLSKFPVTNTCHIPVDYRILAVLQEWVCQHTLRDIDKLRQRVIERQSVIDLSIDRW